MLEACGGGATKLRQQPEELVVPDEVLLPLPENRAPVLVENEGSGVLLMGLTACCGLIIGFSIQVPVCPGDMTGLGFIPRKVGLDPSDSGQLLSLCKYTLPQVSMLETWYMSPLEGAVQCV